MVLVGWGFVPRGVGPDPSNAWAVFLGLVLLTSFFVLGLFMLAARDLSRLLARSQVLKAQGDGSGGASSVVGSSGVPPARVEPASSWSRACCLLLPAGHCWPGDHGEFVRTSLQVLPVGNYGRTISKQTLTVLKDARRGLFARTVKNAIMSESSSELELLERILVTVHVIACSVFAFIVVSLLFFISSFFRVLGLYLIAVLLWSCTGIPFSLAILRFFEGSAGAIARAKRPDGPQRQFSQPGDSAAADSVANGSDDPRGSSYTIDPNWHRSSCDMCSSFSGPEFADGGSRSPSGRRAKSRSTKVQWAERASDLVDKGAARIRAITPAFIKARASDPNDQTLMAGRRTAEVQPTGGLQEVSEESPRLSPGGSHGSGGDGAPRKPSARCKSEGDKDAPRLNHAEL